MSTHTALQTLGKEQQVLVPLYVACCNAFPLTQSIVQRGGQPRRWFSDCQRILQSLLNVILPARRIPSITVLPVTGKIDLNTHTGFFTSRIDTAYSFTRARISECASGLDQDLLITTQAKCVAVT